MGKMTGGEVPGGGKVTGGEMTSRQRISAARARWVAEQLNRLQGTLIASKKVRPDFIVGGVWPTTTPGSRREQCCRCSEFIALSPDSGIKFLELYPGTDVCCFQCAVVLMREKFISLLKSDGKEGFHPWPVGVWFTQIRDHVLSCNECTETEFCPAGRTLFTSGPFGDCGDFLDNPPDSGAN